MCKPLNASVAGHPENVGIALRSLAPYPYPGRCNLNILCTVHVRETLIPVTAAKIIPSNTALQSKSRFRASLPNHGLQIALAFKKWISFGIKIWASCCKIRTDETCTLNTLLLAQIVWLSLSLCLSFFFIHAVCKQNQPRDIMYNLFWIRSKEQFIGFLSLSLSLFWLFVGFFLFYKYIFIHFFFCPPFSFSLMNKL